MFSVILTLAILMSLLMAGAWALQRATGSSGWIDTVWSASVGLGGILAVLLAEGDGGRRSIVFCLVVVWSLRLAGHIGLRTRGGGEDPRYAKLMEQWGETGPRRLFFFLQIQAVAAFVLVLAVYLAASNDQIFPRTIDILATMVALVALAGEALSDAQLSKFRKTPKRKPVYVKPVSGVIHAIPIISSNGFSGAACRCWPSRRTACPGRRLPRPS